MTDDRETPPDQFWKYTAAAHEIGDEGFGVSVENVVARSDTPRSHRKRRPDRKNSWRP